MTYRSCEACRGAGCLVVPWMPCCRCGGTGRERVYPAGPSRVSDGLPVRCQGCGRETGVLYDGVCQDCRGGTATPACEWCGGAGYWHGTRGHRSRPRCQGSGVDPREEGS